MLACQVTQRTREIGIRMALGGTRRAIERLVLAESTRLVGACLLGALAAGPAMRGLLNGVRPLDAGIFGAVALAAAILPARRAQRVDPAAALGD